MNEQLMKIDIELRSLSDKVKDGSLKAEDAKISLKPQGSKEGNRTINSIGKRPNQQRGKKHSFSRREKRHD